MRLNQQRCVSRSQHGINMGDTYMNFRINGRSASKETIADVNKRKLIRKHTTDSIDKNHNLHSSIDNMTGNLKRTHFQFKPKQKGAAIRVLSMSHSDKVDYLINCHSMI